MFSLFYLYIYKNNECHPPGWPIESPCQLDLLGWKTMPVGTFRALILKLNPHAILSFPLLSCSARIHHLQTCTALLLWRRRWTRWVESSSFLHSIMCSSITTYIASHGTLGSFLFSDMRKALSRDVEKKSIIPLKRPVTPDELEYDWLLHLTFLLKGRLNI